MPKRAQLVFDAAPKFRLTSIGAYHPYLAGPVGTNSLQQWSDSVRGMDSSGRASTPTVDWSRLGRGSQLGIQLRIGGPKALIRMVRGAAARAELGIEGRWARAPRLKQFVDVVNARRMSSAWAREAHHRDDDPLSRHEERRFSQNGEDGIIRWIFDQIGVSKGWFVEIGAADGEENCTRSLLEDGWSGVWVEAGRGRAQRAREVAAGRVTVVEDLAEPATIADVLVGAGVPHRPDLLVVGRRLRCHTPDP